MSATCPHGFRPAECLICKTLGSQPPVQVEGGRWSDRRDGRPGRPGGANAIGAGAPAARTSPTPCTRRDLGRAVGPIRWPPTPSWPSWPWWRSWRCWAWSRRGGLRHLAGARVAGGRRGVAGWAGYRWGHYRGRRRGPVTHPGPERARPAATDGLGLRPLTARSVILSVLLGAHPPLLPVRSIVPNDRTVRHQRGHHPGRHCPGWWPIRRWWRRKAGIA